MKCEVRGKRRWTKIGNVRKEESDTPIYSPTKCLVPFPCPSLRLPHAGCEGGTGQAGPHSSLTSTHSSPARVNKSARGTGTSLMAYCLVATSDGTQPTLPILVTPLPSLSLSQPHPRPNNNTLRVIFSQLRLGEFSQHSQLD